MRRLIAILSLVLILAGVNWSIYNKEKQLETGDIAYLQLRPVDPRSLMQGDFMALRFKMSDDIIRKLPRSKRKSWLHRNKVDTTDGYIIATLDEKRIATFKALYKDSMTLADNEIKMQYRVRDGRVKFATNAFFFQEGTAKKYEKALYGQFRVAKNGELLLAKMADKSLKILGK